MMGWIDLDKTTPKKELNTTIAIEFDGVIVENDYPQLGKDNEGAIETLKELTDNGYKLILNTKRNNDELTEAIRYCNQRNIIFESINENIKANSHSGKLVSHLYIETGCLGVPLKKGINNKAVVDWDKIRNILVKWNMLTHKEKLTE